MIVTAVNAAAMPQTTVDVRATGMPIRRDFSEFDAAARTMSPRRVRVMNSASRITRIGTAISTLISRAPMSRSLSTCQLQSLWDERGEVAAGRDVGQQLGEDEHREAEELRDADRRHEQHEARGVGQAADDDDFEEHGRERGDGYRDEHARPQAPAVLGEHAERAEGDGAERDHREVDDPVGAVYEDESGGDRAVRQAHDRAGHHHLLRDVPAVHVDHRRSIPPRRLPGRRGRELYVGGALVGLRESCDTPSGGVDHAAFDVGGIMSYARRPFLVRGTIGALVAALTLGLTAGVGASSAGAVAPTVTPDPATSPFTSTTAFCTKDTAKHTGLKATAPGVTADKISVVAIEPALQPGQSPQGYRFNLGDEVDMLKTFAEMINQCGGINGRQIDLNVIQAQGAGDAGDHAGERAGRLHQGHRGLQGVHRDRRGPPSPRRRASPTTTRRSCSADSPRRAST